MQTSYLLLAVASGSLLPIQAGINAKLLDPLNNSVAPAFVSFLGGSIVLSFVFLAKTQEVEKKTLVKYDRLYDVVNEKTFILIKSASLYLIMLPGLFGAIYVAFAAFLGDRIGFTLFFVSLIAGQLLISIIADSTGFLGLEKKPATPLRILAMLLVFSGSIISVSENLSSSIDETDIPTAELIIYMALSCFSGAMLGLQPSLNAKLQRHMGSQAHRITWWSFVNGTLWLLLFTAISLPVTAEPIEFENIPDIEVWKFFGGPLGTIFVFSSVFLAPRIGLGGFVVAAVAGQLISSLLVDTFGLLQSQKVEISVSRVVGVIVVYLAVILFRLETQILSLIWSRNSEDLSSLNEDVQEPNQDVELKLS